MSNTFDIIILGSGYVGSLAALVMSRKGYSVALIERSAQPRFSVGESNSPDQDRVHLTMAHQFGIPELGPLSSYTKIKKNQLPISVWPKEVIWFLFDGPHRGNSQPDEIGMQAVPWPVGPDYHCMRADYDLYLLTLARKYGAHYFGMAELRQVHIGDKVSCEIETPIGTSELEARFVIDASGPNSVLARNLSIPMIDPDENSLRSRSIFSHFINANRIEKLYVESLKPIGIPRDNGTLHSLWDGGWAWIIPFDNGITSIGVVLDLARDSLDHSKLSSTEAFWTVVKDNHYLSSILEHSNSIRPYDRTGQIQRRAEKIVGDKWIMLPPAGGLADPLLSPGNAVAANCVGRLAWAIDSVLRDGRPGSEALDFIERRFFLEFKYIRKVQDILFQSFYSPEVFRETFVLFPMAVRLGIATRPEPNEAPAFQASWGFGNSKFRDLTDRLCDVVKAGRKSNVNASQLASQVRQTIREADSTRYAKYFFPSHTTPDLHFNRLHPLVRWSLGLRRSRDSEIAAASKGAVKNIVGHLWRSRVLTGRRPSLATMIMRQIWIQLTGSFGRKVLGVVFQRRRAHKNLVIDRGLRHRPIDSDVSKAN